ncbi:hypothetical protein, partial [Anabaena sp. UHCC 0187]|uniref:hypothetical protein n=1 Tax=Anabaena sp. UHCC 0187 TaxID=2590018 RepID=UPI003529ED95
VFLVFFLISCGNNETQTKSSSPISVPSTPSVPSTQNTVVAKPEVTPSPPATDSYQDAISKAIGAATITQSAQSQNDWTLIIGMWQGSINLMETVPKTSPNYASAQSKIKEYQGNLKFAQQMALKPPSTANPEPLTYRVSNAIKPQNSKINIQSIATNQVSNKKPSLVKPSPINKNTTISNSSRISGYLELVDSNIGGTDSNCYGTEGFKDIEGGMPVTVKDGQGKIISLGKTSYGKRPKGEYSSVRCIFYFQVNNVPIVNFYSIEVGRRGQLNYSYEELKNKNWKVSFSLS